MARATSTASRCMPKMETALYQVALRRANSIVKSCSCKEGKQGRMSRVITVSVVLGQHASE